MTDCPFCNFNDPSQVICEDDRCFAVISKNPINKYHVLVIPKTHVESFVDLSDDLASHIFLVAKRLSAAVRKASNPDAIHHLSDDDIHKKGFNLVRHYKLHIIPRFDDDGTIIEWKRQELSDEERSAVAAVIRAGM